MIENKPKDLHAKKFQEEAISDLSLFQLNIKHIV